MSENFPSQEFIYIPSYRVPNHKQYFLIFNLWGEEQWYFDISDHFLKIQSSTIWLRLSRVQWFGLMYLNLQKQKNGESVSKLFIVQIQNFQIHSWSKYFSQMMLDNNPDSHFATKEHDITNILEEISKTQKLDFATSLKLFQKIFLPVL